MPARFLKYFLSFALSLFFLLTINSLVLAAKAEIVDFAVTNKNGYVYIDAKLKGAFTKGISEAIESGITTTFKYYIELKKPRFLPYYLLLNLLKLLNIKSGQKLLLYSVEYDTLKKEYRVTVDDGIFSQVKITRDEREMRKWMTTIESFKVFPSRDLKPEGLSLKAEMKCIKIIFPLNYLLPFISLWNFDTPWVTSPIPAAVAE